MNTTTDRSQHTNRLARETSPYLLQHQHNPVDWYPWGDEAFEAARAQDRPIFLSVGYSTCYWCHVMERQCFESEPIARLMNELFVNIKVDREERPDVDQLYMNAVTVLTRHGGWPMSVFLTPQLKPFFGGTYFPPEDAHGRPGFPTVLRAIADAYRNRRGDVETSADQLVSILEQLARPTPASRALTIDPKFIDELIERSVSDYDPRFGGFGSAPKFPRETLLELLLSYCAQRKPTIGDRQSAVLQRVRHTLDAMANGGIRDHLGGGFHRYSTDERWLVPHFEIMLYDNAMLAWCYVEAYRQTEEPRYARVARGILDFVLRELSDAETGAFHTALDAEVDGQEGLNYLWTADEVKHLLKRLKNGDSPLFLRLYGLDRGPNFADPHHGSGVPDKNVLYLPDGPQLEDDPRIVEMRQVLYAARRQRKQPLLDTKVITSWNALMIRALSYGGQVLQEARYVAAAERAATFLLQKHRTDDRGLLRTSREGRAKYDAFLDDYAFLAQALLALRDSSGRDAWRDRAAEIADVMRQRFGAEAGGFYFTAESAHDLIVRQMIATDSPLPSGTAVAAMVMEELDQVEVARRTIATFAPQLESSAEGMSSMVQAAMRFAGEHGSIQIQSAPGTEAERPLAPPDMALRVVGLRAGWHDPSLLEVRLQVLRGFHVNSNRPAPGMIPTELRAVGEGTDVESIEYPPGEEQRFAFADAPVRVYSGEVRILVRFRSAKSGKPPVRLALYYQACDESACLPPVTKQLEVPTP